MDVFAGDDFPDHVAPFPETSDFLCAQSMPLIQPPDIIADRLQNPRPPPHKLRPIRCNGRSSPVTSPHVGFLSNQLCVDNGESSQNLQSLRQQVEANVAIGDDLMENPADAGSDHSAHNWDPNDEGCLLEQESGSSSDADDNSSESTKEPGSGKRRKKTMKMLEVFLENLVKKVMEKQEQMHKQLVDLIEKKERERVMREEAWKQKEIERIKRDEETRLQEKSRNLALILFIQNFLGHEIQIPQPAVGSLRAEEEGEVNTQRDFKSDLSNNRWPEAEVQALITLRTSLEPKFRLMGSKGSIWEEISEAMHNMGYNRSAKKCKEKWENINKYYKRTIGSGKKRCLNSKTCPYFDELDILYRNGLLNVGNALSNTIDVAKIEEEQSEC